MRCTAVVSSTLAMLVADIQRRGLEVERVVGIHGNPVPFSELQAAAARAP